jgi:subtilisin family serine protease
VVTEDPRRYNVGARKIPHEQRDVAHAVLTPEDDRGYLDVMGADGENGVELDGEMVATYSVLLTDTEADTFRGASNARYVELDQVCAIPEPVAVEPVDTTDTHTVTVPETAVLDWLGARVPGHTGTGVTIGVIDGGTTRDVRTAVGCVLAARRNFSADPIWTDDQITVEHGCFVTPLAVPRGARLIEAITADSAGRSTHSASAAAMRWAADQGARIINYSSGGSSPSATMRDAVRYLSARGVVLVASAGNEGLADYLSWPARYCEEFGNVKSSIAFTLGRTRATFSNHKATGSGAAPGAGVLTYDRLRRRLRVSGTSFSAPLMARLIALIVSGGRFTATQAADALERTTIDTPEPAEEEGAGAWNLALAMGSLGATTTAEAPSRSGVSWWERLTVAVTRVLHRVLWK